MKLCFKNAFETVPGIRYLMPELGFCIADEKTADAVVNVIVTEEDVLSVTSKAAVRQYATAAERRDSSAALPHCAAGYAGARPKRPCSKHRLSRPTELCWICPEMPL